MNTDQFVDAALRLLCCAAAALQSVSGAKHELQARLRSALLLQQQEEAGSYDGEASDSEADVYNDEDEQAPIGSAAAATLPIRQV
jgi:hypothetical protein